MIKEMFNEISSALIENETFNDILKSVWNLNGKDPIKILKQIDK